MRFEPNADARIAAVAAWSQYQAFLQAGFTEEQAMHLMDTLIQASSGGQR